MKRHRHELTDDNISITLQQISLLSLSVQNCISEQDSGYRKEGREREKAVLGLVPHRFCHRISVTQNVLSFTKQVLRLGTITFVTNFILF